MKHKTLFLLSLISCLLLNQKVTLSQSNPSEYTIPPFEPYEVDVPKKPQKSPAEEKMERESKKEIGEAVCSLQKRRKYLYLDPLIDHAMRELYLRTNNPKTIETIRHSQIPANDPGILGGFLRLGARLIIHDYAYGICPNTLPLN